MSNYNQKKQKVENQINAENVEQDIENSGKLNQSINAKKVQIGNKPVSCPKCKTSNKGTDKFCKKCGQSLTNLCLTCWTENDLATVFCTSCGIEVKKSKFSIPPELTQKWIDKFASLGWNRSSLNGQIKLAALERMGQPVDSQHEIPILDAAIMFDVKIEKVSVANRECKADFVHPTKQPGGIFITTQRIMVSNYAEGWIASYPHAYLIDSSASQGSNAGGQSTIIFNLDYGSLGEIKIHKVIPSLYKRTLFEQITRPYSPAVALENTMINTVLAKRIQDTHDENTIFINFFQSITELQRTFHQHKRDFTANLNIKTFIEDVPEIKLPADDDSCAPKAAAMLMLAITFVSIVISWLS